MVELARRPIPGREHLERPPNQRCPLLVQLNGTNLATELVAHPNVAVADGRLRHRPALRGLLRQALDDLRGQVPRVELGNRRHDAVQQHPRGRLVDVLRRRHQRHPGILECQVDGHVVGAVPSQPVNLVDDAVVRLVLRDVLDHPHQLRAIGLVSGLASIDELLDDGRAELVGLALVRFPLGWDREAFGAAALLCLLLGRDPEVGDGDRADERRRRYEAVYCGAVRVGGRHGSPPQSLVLPTRTDVTADVDREKSPKAVGLGRAGHVCFASPRGTKR